MQTLVNSEHQIVEVIPSQSQFMHLFILCSFCCSALVLMLHVTIDALCGC